MSCKPREGKDRGFLMQLEVKILRPEKVLFSEIPLKYSKYDL
jgi:hypothetical protein